MTKVAFLIVCMMTALTQSTIAFASVNDLMAIESHFQNKVLEIIRPIDSNAQVSVRLTLKPQRIELAGSGITLTDAYSHFESDLNPNEIQNLTVWVQTPDAALPEEIRSRITEVIGLSTEKLTINLDALPKSVGDLALKNSSVASVRRMSDDFKNATQTLSTMQNYLGYILILALLASITAIALFLHLGRGLDRSLAQLTEKMAQAGVNDSSTNAVEMALPPPHRKEYSTSTGLNSANSPLADLGNEAVEALLSDCYWCQEDGYGRWLWLMMTPTQKAHVLNSWPEAENYVRHLVSIDGVEKDYHLHPYYIRPMLANEVSLSDMKSWLRKSPGLWLNVSPLRQIHLDFSLQEKFEMSQAQPVTQTPPLPQSSGQKRGLGRNFEIGNLSEKDEIALMKSPNSIPEAARTNIPSLVWLALLPEDDIRSLLSEFSAAALADAWVGPVELLSRLNGFLPDKKRKLLEDYLRRAPGRRESVVLKNISARALSQMREEETIADAA